MPNKRVAYFVNHKSCRCTRWCYRSEFTVKLSHW